MTAADIEQLERDIATMRAAGHTRLPLRFEVIERLIAAERKRLGLAPARKGRKA